MLKLSKRKQKGLKKLSLKLKVFLTIFIILMIIIGIFSYLNSFVNPVIIDVSQSKIKSLAQKAVSTAMYDVLKNNAVYDSLITITRNEDGEILMINSNALQINMLTRELARSAQNKLEIIGNDGIDIPIGSFSGMPIFMGRGPKISIKIVPIGSINSNFISEFVSAGINQTNHRIFLNVQSNVNVILPTESTIITTNTQMLICESIIIGKIPQTFLMSTDLSNLMDLIPG